MIIERTIEFFKQTLTFRKLIIKKFHLSEKFILALFFISFFIGLTLIPYDIKHSYSIAILSIILLSTSFFISTGLTIKLLLKTSFWWKKSDYHDYIKHKLNDYFKDNDINYSQVKYISKQIDTRLNNEKINPTFYAILLTSLGALLSKLYSEITTVHLLDFSLYLIAFVLIMSFLSPIYHHMLLRLTTNYHLLKELSDYLHEIIVDRTQDKSNNKELNKVLL